MDFFMVLWDLRAHTVRPYRWRFGFLGMFGWNGFIFIVVIPENAHFIPRANGHEIRAVAGIIVITEANILADGVIHITRPSLLSRISRRTAPHGRVPA